MDRMVGRWMGEGGIWWVGVGLSIGIFEGWGIRRLGSLFGTFWFSCVTANCG